MKVMFQCLWSAGHCPVWLLRNLVAGSCLEPIAEAAPLILNSLFKLLVAWCQLGDFENLTMRTATALVLTRGWFIMGEWCAAPSRRMRDQLLWLDRVKSICEVDSSHHWRLAPSRDFIRWSAMSGSPDSSYCFRTALHSASIHGMNVGLNSEPSGYLREQPSSIQGPCGACLGLLHCCAD